MPHEHLPGPPISNFSSHSALPSRLDLEPRRDQPLGEAPLFAEGTHPPPYPPAIDPGAVDVTDEYLSAAAQDLLSYIDGMGQRMEQRNRSRANVAERKPESDSARPDIRLEELGSAG